MTAPTYTIGRIRPMPTGNVVYEIVTAAITRMAVMIPRAHTADDDARSIIEHAIAARTAPRKPLR